MSYEEVACPTCGQHYQLTASDDAGYELAWTDGYQEGHYFSDGFSRGESRQLFTKCNGCLTFFWREEGVTRTTSLPLTNLDDMLRAAKEGKLENKIAPERIPHFVEQAHKELLTRSLGMENELYVRKKIWWEFNHEYRFPSFVETYPKMQEVCFKKTAGRLEYLFKRTLRLGGSVPAKYSSMINEGMDNMTALRQWMHFKNDKVYITFSEDADVDESDYYPGPVTVDELLFYERTRRNWERREWPDQKKNLQALVHLLEESTSNHRLMKAEAYRHLGEFQNCISLLKDVSPSPLVSKLLTEARKGNRKNIPDTFPDYR